MDSDYNMYSTPTHITKMLFKALLCSKNKILKKSYSVLEVIKNVEAAMKTTLEVKFRPV